MTWANTALTPLLLNVPIAVFTCAGYMLKNVQRVERRSAPVVSRFIATITPSRHKSNGWTEYANEPESPNRNQKYREQL
jgi:hypothetical protein